LLLKTGKKAKMEERGKEQKGIEENRNRKKREG
jgi:hypothetical protein